MFSSKNQLYYIANFHFTSSKRRKHNVFHKIFSPQKNMGETFDAYYNAILNVISDTAKKYTIYYDFELVPFFHTLTFYYVANIKKSKQEKVTYQINKIFIERFAWYYAGHNGKFNPAFSSRLNFYRNIAKGEELRAEWCAGTQSTQPDIRMFIAFGDRIYNPDCAKDYEQAPMLIRDINEMVEFSEMMDKVKHLIICYCNEFKAL